MNLFDDAATFMKDKTPAVPEVADTLDLDNPTERTKIITYLRAEYENATLTEIDRAIDKTIDTLEKPYSKALFLKKIRPKLED